MGEVRLRSWELEQDYREYKNFHDLMNAAYQSYIYGAPMKAKKVVKGKRKYTKRSPKWKTRLKAIPGFEPHNVFPSDPIPGSATAQWKDSTEWRLAGLYACLGYEGKTALLRSVSIEYGPGNAECVWHDLDGARVGSHCIARCFGPITEDKE